jgi:hypothetical protein
MTPRAFESQFANNSNGRNFGDIGTYIEEVETLVQFTARISGGDWSGGWFRSWWARVGFAV